MNDNHQKSSNTVWHHATVTRERRQKLNGHKSTILWFTGLSGAGKSSLAHALEERLYQMKCRTYVLDGDNVRHGLCGDLSFSEEDRQENIRRIGNVAKLFLESGVIVLTAFISPFKKDRAIVRNMVEHGDFIEIYCNTPIEVCEKRDVKGLYKRARQGKIKEFTGISSPYEEPINPDITILTGKDAIDDCVEQIINLLKSRNILEH